MDPPTRCKFFEDDGTPIGSGCRFGDAKCRFIHPNNPIWNSTMSHKGHRTSPRFHRRSATEPEYPGRTSSRSQRRGSQSYTQNDSGKTSYLGSERPKKRHRRHNSNSSLSNATAEAATWSWGDSSNEPGPSRSKQSEIRPPSTNNSMGSLGAGWSLGSWGDSTEGSPWGGGLDAGGASTWNENPWRAQLAWGEDTKQNNIKTAEPKSTFSDGHPPTTNSPSILHASPTLSRVPIHDDGSHKLTSQAISSSSTQELDMRHGAHTTSSASASLTASKRIPLPTRRPLLPTRVKQSSTTSSIRESTDNELLPASPAVPSQDWSGIPLSSSITRRVHQDDMASDASGPISHLARHDPKELHAKLIKEMINVVVTRCRLLKAEETKMKWREARQSLCYHHSTPAAQKILESTNHQFSEALGKLNKQLNSSLKRVIQSSDALDTHKDLVAKRLDWQKILSYTDELRDWIASTELPRRILATKVLIQRENEEKEAFRRRKREEVEVLKNAINELELRASNIWDDFCHIQYVQPEHFREELIATEKSMGGEDVDAMLNLEKIFADMGVGINVFETVEEGANVLDRSVDNHMSKAEELQEEIRVLEEEVLGLRQMDQEINEFRQEAHVKLRGMELWKMDDRRRLNQMSQEIESLHKISRPRTDSAAIVIARAEGLAPYVNQLVTAYVAKEIKPALDAIAEACERNNQLVKADFDKLVKQVVMKTHDLVQMALKTNGLVPQIVPQHS